jgi:hypothetical protein
MPSLEVIKASEAPGVPAKQSKYATELLHAIQSLRKDEALRLKPDEGKSMRGLRTGIGRITKGAGVKVSVWSDDDYAYIVKG